MICFRPMAPGDLDAVAALEAASFSRPWRREDFADALTKAHYLYYIAERDGVHLATAGLIRSLEEADICNVAVASGERRQGIARGLLEELLEVGRRVGISAFSLEVREHNTAAIALYESLGFRQEGTRARFYTDPVEDARIYWLRDNGDGTPRADGAEAKP